MQKFKSIYKLKIKSNEFEGGQRLKKKIISKPFLTIIIVVLNQEKFIERAIKSVLNQNFKKYEIIIIDGRSTDKTLNIIKKYSKDISYWVSQKDKGIYDAFNKGMLLARGKYIGILNSDDKYTANGLLIFEKYALKYPEKNFIFGSVKKHWGILHGYRPEKIKYSWGFYTSHSTGFFLQRSAAKEVGLYNLRYKYHADYDYFYRMIVKKNLKGVATKKNEVVGIFTRGGFSSTIPYRKMFFEDLKIRYDNGQSIILLLILAIYKILNYWKKKFMNN